jgi:hypothetical protein
MLIDRSKQQVVRTLKNCLLALIMATLTYEAYRYVSLGWHELFVFNRTFSYLGGVIDIGRLVSWVPDVMVFGVSSYIMGRVVKSNHRIGWAMSVGLIGTLYFFLYTKHYFTEHSTISTYIWAYFGHFMPLIGSTIGGLLAAWVSNMLLRKN